MSTPAEWLEAGGAAERPGGLLSALDPAEEGLEGHPGDVPPQHPGVLALARAGATGHAAERFAQYGLADVATEDVRALEARIAKDTALAAEGDERRRLALRSAALYEAIFADTEGYYPGINAATLQLVGGDAGSSRRLARGVLEILGRTGDDGYYGAASEAEAHLLLDQTPAACSALERAASLHGGDYGAVATTRPPLRIVRDQPG